MTSNRTFYLRPFRVLPLAALLLFAIALTGAAEECESTWDNALSTLVGLTGPSGGMNYLHDLAVFDHGDGPQLYAGGQFNQIAGIDVAGLARWDGTRWERAGVGINSGGIILGMAVYDDGSGPALYVAGSFTEAGGEPAGNMARFDGESWSVFDNGMDAKVDALAVYDDGSGEQLYATGSFSSAGGVSAAGLARWDGESWSEVGGGLEGGGRALHVHDFGSGPELVIGGTFTRAGMIDVSHIVRWNGGWSTLGTGVFGDPFSTWVGALTTLDEGDDTSLIVGGQFDFAGTMPDEIVDVASIARYRNGAWSAVGETGVPASVIRTLASFDDGAAPSETLYANQHRQLADGSMSNRIARFDGTDWLALGEGLDYDAGALLTFDDGHGEAVFVAGGFTEAGGVPVLGIGRWDGQEWSMLGHRLGGSPPVNDFVEAAVGGPDSHLYAVGEFTLADGYPANGVARWTGSGWSALGEGLEMPTVVSVAAAFDDGNGTSLYAGGRFTRAGDEDIAQIARWDGETWSALDGELDNEGSLNPTVVALLVHDDGSGPALYVGGRFSHAGEENVNHVARWDGSGWSALGDGLDYEGSSSPIVHSLAIHDEGDGPMLYAAGRFNLADGEPAPFVARWDGQQWSSVGGGMDRYVRALVSWNDGSGPLLVAGGRFDTAGDSAARRLAAWDGQSWSELGGGLDGPPNQPIVNALAVQGGRLYVGGHFSQAGDVAVANLAARSGQQWEAMDGGTASEVYALLSGSGPEGPLYVGGDFFRVGDDLPVSLMARWQDCPAEIPLPDRIFSDDFVSPADD